MRAVTLTERSFVLASALANARSRWTERRSLVLTLEHDSGERGHGEASPLPGYSDHTLEDCRGALARLSAAACATLAELAPTDLGAAVRAQCGDAPPEARFALETALLDLRARRARRPLYRVLAELASSEPATAPLPLIALLPPLSEGSDWERATARAVVAGYAGVKAKVGVPGALDAELAALTRVRAALGPARRLRLDANGSLAPDALHALARFAPEFVEEPCAPGLPGHDAPPIPIALDESLRSGPDAAADHPRVVAWVLKLGPLGGLTRALEFVRAARQRKVEVVVSHTLEGPIALAAAAELALALGPGAFGAGLAPHSGIAQAELPAAYHGATLVPHGQPGLGLRPVTRQA